jgi:hypothetical protein
LITLRSFELRAVDFMSFRGTKDQHDAFQLLGYGREPIKRLGGIFL